MEELMGMEATLRTFKKYRDGITPAIDEALRVFMGMILWSSQEYCPKDTKELVETSKLVRGEGPGEWVISYGEGGLGYYAIYVHEMPSTFNFTTPGTGPRYLSRAVDDWIPHAQDIIGPEVWKRVIREIEGPYGVDSEGNFLAPP